MKIFSIRVIVLFLFSFLFSSAFSQTPQKMSYQAVVRNSNNKLVSNTAVGMKVSILKGSATGTPVYVETHAPTANTNGLVSIEIGAGTAILGSFSAINWVDGPYFIKTETDPAGGTNYSITGTSQLLSTPYALFADRAATAENVLNNNDADADSTNELQVLSINGDTIFLTKGGFVKLPAGFDGNYSSLSGTPQNVSNFINDAGYITGFANVDTDTNNEIQTLTKTGSTISLSRGGGTITDRDSQNITSASLGTTRYVYISGGLGTSFDIKDDDADTTNEIQTLKISNDTVSLTNGGFVKLPPVWSIAGNSGTNDATSFIGTTDNIPFNIRVNNEKAGKIDHILLNTFFGYQSGKAISTGTNNAAIGHQALYTNTTGNYLVANGCEALYSNTIGNYNTAIGQRSMYSNTKGNYNTAIGYHSLYASIDGNSNVANGYESLLSNLGGEWNIAVGTQALLSNNGGNNNVAIGGKAMYYNINSSNNVAVGYQSLYSNSGGNAGGNIAVGPLALYASVSGEDNVAVGRWSMLNNTSGKYNTCLGGSSGSNITTGSSNIMIGFNISAPIANASNQLSLGNIIYATGVSSGTTVSSGNAGVRISAPQSAWDVSGSLGTAITTTSSNLTLDGTHYTVIITGGTPILTLPAASAATRRIYVLVNRTGSAATVSSYNAISGSTSTTITANSKITLQSDGTNWYQID